MLTLEDLIREKTCCASGHRPDKLDGYGTGVRLHTAIREVLFDKVKLAYEEGYRFYGSGFAQGTDTFFNEAVIRLKAIYPDVHLIAFIPFEPGEVNGKFESQYSKWPKSSQELYFEHLKQASLVHNVCGKGYATWKMNKRNNVMADAGNKAFTVWDGSSGGTGNFIEYAKRLHDFTIDNTDPNDLRKLLRHY